MNDGFKIGCFTFMVPVVIVILVAVIGLFSFGAKLFLAPLGLANKVVDTGAQVVNKTLDADNVIYNYEFFKEQYHDYKAIKVKAERAVSSLERFKADLPEDRTQWTFEDKNELSRLRSIADGMAYQLQDIVSEYNAKSKMINRKIFKGRDVPAELPLYEY